MFFRLFQIVALTSTAFVFISCSDNGGSTYNPDVGPFDEDGNYVEEWADNPPKRGAGRKSTTIATKPKPHPVVPKVVSPRLPAAKPVTTPRPTTVAKVTPKPKPVIVKPKSARHIVKKGETIYGLSRRYGTTVSAIKRANGISGTTIITGKSYIIPR